MYVEEVKITREAQLLFCEGEVRKLWPSALWLAKAQGVYIGNLTTKERMDVREEADAYELDVQFGDKNVDVTILCSAAGCNVWP